MIILEDTKLTSVKNKKQGYLKLNKMGKVIILGTKDFEIYN